MSKGNTLKHIIITIPHTWNKESKKKVIQSLKSVGVDSACIIYAPFDESDKFFLKTTLHVFYYGKLKNLYNMKLYNIYEQNDLDGTNQTLFRILQRQYLNAGIKKGIHPVSWIGKSVYCTLETQKSDTDGRNCPLCNKKLHLIYFDGDFPPIPPDESFNGELDKDGWQYCPTDSIWIKLFKKIKRKVLAIKSKLISMIFYE